MSTASLPQAISTATPSLAPSPQATATATSSKSPTLIATPIAAPTALSGSDRAYNLIGGIWTCHTFAGTPITHQYHRDDDTASLIVDSTVQIEGRTAELRETYRFHHSTSSWSASLADGKFVATAKPWFGEKWLFEGIDTERGHAADESMTYEWISADSFARIFSIGDLKKTSAGENCVRVAI